MDHKEEVQQLRSELAHIETELREQYARLQQVQLRLQQIDPSGAKGSLTAVGPRRFSLENFIGLRLIHLVGIVVLVIGLSIGVKYAFDRNLISEVARIGLAYLAGGLLLGVSVWLRSRYAGFSAILFSGAMATFYFTSYAANVYYGLLSFGLVFGLMVLLTVATAWQAFRYNRPEIALLGLVGAYAIPFLISRNAERADLFFLYITIINAGVLFLRLRKPWPQVAQVAQLLSWVLFIGWASTRFQPAQSGTAYLYLVIFFLLFTVMIFGKSSRGTALPKVAVYFLLLNHIAAFGAALFIVSPALETGTLATVALIFALLAALQAFAGKWIQGKDSYLQQAFTLLSVGLVVLATVWYFDGLRVTFIWLLLAVGLFALGASFHSRLWRLASLGLMALTLLKLLVVDSQRFNPGQKVAAYIALGLLLLVVSFFYQKFRSRWFEE